MQIRGIRGQGLGFWGFLNQAGQRLYPRITRMNTNINGSKFFNPIVPDFVAVGTEPKAFIRVGMLPSLQSGRAFPVSGFGMELQSA